MIAAALSRPASMLAQVFVEPAPSVDWVAMIPYLVLIGGGLVLLTVMSVAGRWLPSWFAACFTSLVGVGALGSAMGVWIDIGNEGPSATLSGAVGIDRFSVFVAGVLGAVVALVALLAQDYVRREKIWGNELYVLLMLSAAGGAIMAGANDLIVLFLGLEVLSIAAYVLAALNLRKSASLEAGMKYFVLGAFSSAFLLYGIALVYGAVGSTNLARVSEFLETGGLAEDGLLLGGFALMLVGLFFKIAAVPFHAWTPDVYQGSPTPVVGYMAAGVKIAGFAALLRVFVGAFGSYGDDWQPMVYAVAIVTMLVGSVVAIVQGDVKRMLAYSSISHAGFVLVAVEANSTDGTAAALFYLAAYAVIAVGSFAVVSVVAGGGGGGGTDDGAGAGTGGRAGGDTSAGGERVNLSDYRGLAGRHPVLSAALLVLLLAQAGVPFTSGFFAKFFVIGAAVDVRSYWLAVVAMVLAVVAAFIYLRLVVAMYLSDGGDGGGEPDDAPAISASPRERFVIAVCVGFTLAFGIVPGVLHELANDAILAITP